MKRYSAVHRYDIAKRLIEIPVLTPSEMEAEMLRRGFRGQEQARKQLCVFAYRHLQRLRRIFIQDIPIAALPPREHMLCLGPSGSGKTFSITTLFRDILGLPAVIIDMTRYTETGYFGENVPTILSDLYDAAGKNENWMSVGVVCLDEFDKLASCHTSRKFNGGTSKDVSGAGVQRELLTMLSGDSCNFPLRTGNRVTGREAQMEADLNFVSFVACGAFSGIETLWDDQRSCLGFHGIPRDAGKETSGSLPEASAIEIARGVEEFGVMPELLGRFSHHVVFPKLNYKALYDILRHTILPQFQEEFFLEGIQVEFTEKAKEFACKEALKRSAGARGISAIFGQILHQAAWKYYGRGKAHIVLDVINGSWGVIEDSAAEELLA